MMYVVLYSPSFYEPSKFFAIVNSKEDAEDIDRNCLDYRGEIHKFEGDLDLSIMLKDCCKTIEYTDDNGERVKEQIYYDGRRKKV